MSAFVVQRSAVWHANPACPALRGALPMVVPDGWPIPLAKCSHRHAPTGTERVRCSRCRQRRKVALDAETP